MSTFLFVAGHEMANLSGRGMCLILPLFNYCRGTTQISYTFPVRQRHRWEASTGFRDAEKGIEGIKIQKQGKQGRQGCLV
mmetsp:Transcript_48468/g.125747  ORF Transcript_48468/g.125747 Transcript_48468/m.125747 type:complete len:80 (+) Transcript_48468:1603-1842(+)